VRAVIDETDWAIIGLLRENGRLPNTEIAKGLKISEAAVRKRLKRLIDEEIVRVAAVVNHLKLGYELEGNIKIRIDVKKTEHVKEELNRIDSLWYIAHLTGASDFDVEFSVGSQEELRALMARIGAIDGVVATETSVRLQLVKNLYDRETLVRSKGR